MKKRTKIIIAGVTGLVAVGGVAIAAQGYEEHRQMKRLFAPQKIMQSIDKNGDLGASREELSEFVKLHFVNADANKDQKITKGEVVDAIEGSKLPDKAKRHSGKITDRVFSQMDIDLDGSVTLSEMENRIGKFHALVDWNDDNTVEMAELKRLRQGFGHRRHKGDRD